MTMHGVTNVPALYDLRRTLDDGFRVEEVDSTDHHVLLMLRRDDELRTLALDAEEALALCAEDWERLLVPAV